MSWIPVISQLKSLVQVCTGDAAGAKKTQIEFLRQCPVVSQCTSLVYSIEGNNNQASEVQMEFLQTMGCVVDGIPLAGHVKGGIHFACGDDERGRQSIKSSSRTTLAVIGGVIGGSTTGPPGAICGGIAGAAIMDSTTTATESIRDGKFKPHGYFALGKDIYEDISEGKYHKIGGHVFDTALTVTMDGLAGRAAYKWAAKNLPVEVLDKIIEEPTPDVHPVVEEPPPYDPPLPDIPVEELSLEPTVSEVPPVESPPPSSSSFPPDLPSPPKVPVIPEETSFRLPRVPRRSSAPELFKQLKETLQIRKKAYFRMPDFDSGFNPLNPGAWSIYYHIVEGMGQRVLAIKARIVSAALRVRTGLPIDTNHTTQIVNSISRLHRTAPQTADRCLGICAAGCR
eukprot:gene30740-37142_t